MAKHRIRRWFQFGVLDLLILTTIVAIGAVLWRPAQAESIKAPPWLVGVWVSDRDDNLGFDLLPDGCYRVRQNTPTKWGYPWSMARFGDAQDKFVLECGHLRLIVRSEWGSGVVEVLHEDGTVKSRLEQFARVEGAWRDGVLDGTWTINRTHVPLEDVRVLLEYRRGEPVDLHESGTRRLAVLNEIRRARGLDELTEHDFPGEGTPEEETR